MVWLWCGVLVQLGFDLVVLRWVACRLVGLSCGILMLPEVACGVWGWYNTVVCLRAASVWRGFVFDLLLGGCWLGRVVPLWFLWCLLWVCGVMWVLGFSGLGLYLVVDFAWFGFGIGVDCGFRGFSASGLVVWVGCVYWLVMRWDELCLFGICYSGGFLWVVINRWVVVGFAVVASCEVGGLRLFSCVCALVPECWVLRLFGASGLVAGLLCCRCCLPFLGVVRRDVGVGFVVDMDCWL